MTDQEYNMELDLKNISAATEETYSFLERSGLDAKERLAFKLLLEELLLDYMNINGSKKFKIIFRSRLKKISIHVWVDGSSRNPLTEPLTPMQSTLLSNLNSPLLWKYRHGQNVIDFSPKMPQTDFRMTKKILSAMMKKKWILILACVLRFLQMLFNVVEPIISAKIIIAYSASEIKKIYIAAGLLLVQAAASSLLNYVTSRMLRASYGEMVKQMKHDLSDSILRIKTDCMDENGTGVFTQRLINETEKVVDSMDAILDATIDLFRLISVFAAFALISVNMFAFEIVLFTIFFLIQRAHQINLTDDMRRCSSAIEKHTSFTGEMVRANRDIKLLHCEDSFKKKLNRSIDESVDLVTDMRFKSMKFILLRTQFVSWSNFIYMALLALQMSMGHMSAATALILYNYNGRVYSCSYTISSMLTSIYDLNLSSERIYQLMNSKDYEKESFGTVHLDTVKGDIELHNVYFSYKRANGTNISVLKGISLHIKAGEFVAFVGKSGCGKSTVLSLISRLYDADSGTITLDGHNIKQLDQDTIRSNIQTVSQMPYIFNMSIRDNLMVVKDDLSDDEMINACKIACIHDDIMRLPQGYDTVVGEDGISLSGGQRQRIAIARSIVLKHPIMMFDEATSALDNITQAKIREALDSMQGSQTIIMIAHRLSTVVNCEHLFFLEDGKVLAEGTHKELLETCPEYRQLYSEESIGDENEQ